MKRLFIVAAMTVLAACSRHEETQVTTPASTSEPSANQTAAAAAPITVPAGAYTLDKSHASLLFRVNHLGFSKYTARFRAFDAQMQLDPANLAVSSVTATIDPKSLDLENPPAGFVAELLGTNWLDAAKFPELTFRSTAAEVTGPNAVKITGDLTLHGVTHPVALNATLNGGYAGHPMDPHARVGFSARGTFKRSDFGVAYGVPAPGSTMGVSDEVEVIIESEFSGPAWTAPDTETPAQS